MIFSFTQFFRSLSHHVHKPKSFIRYQKMQKRNVLLGTTEDSHLISIATSPKSSHFPLHDWIYVEMCLFWCCYGPNEIFSRSIEGYIFSTKAVFQTICTRNIDMGICRGRNSFISTVHTSYEYIQFNNLIQLKVSIVGTFFKYYTLRLVI